MVVYYNRAPYLNTSAGRFWTMDSHKGYDEIPLSLHKYLFADADPIDNLDPRANEIDEVIGSFSLSTAINGTGTCRQEVRYPAPVNRPVRLRVSKRAIERVAAQLCHTLPAALLLPDQPPPLRPCPLYRLRHAATLLRHSIVRKMGFV
jgi:hypothetical protein